MFFLNINTGGAHSIVFNKIDQKLVRWVALRKQPANLEEEGEEEGFSLNILLQLLMLNHVSQLLIQKVNFILKF